MRITQIEIFRAAMPFDAGRRDLKASSDAASADGDAFNAASRTLQQMETLLVKVSTDDGRAGWGEAFGHLINPVTFAALAGPVGRFFIGTELSADPASFVPRMTAAHQAFHAFGRTGPVLYALSAMDIALWDLSAQAAGVPLNRLISTASGSTSGASLDAPRDRVDVYASLVSYDNDPDEVAYQVRRAYHAGFRKMKLHETEPVAIAAAREALPADAALMVDVNCPWDVDTARSRAASLKHLGLGWIEEPVWPPDDAAGLARVREAGVPISAGENASGVAGFLTYFEQRAIDIAQPSVTKIGGISGVLDVIRLAGSFDVKVIPHCFYYGAGLLATAHLVSLLPADVWLEIPWLQWPETLHPVQTFAPSLTLPNTPGLGFAPDPDVLKRRTIDYASIGGTTSP